VAKKADVKKLKEHEKKEIKGRKKANKDDEKMIKMLGKKNGKKKK